MIMNLCNIQIEIKTEIEPYILFQVFYNVESISFAQHLDS